VAVLLPSRASFRALRGAFFFGVAFFPAFGLPCALFARRAPAPAFFVAFVSGVVSAVSIVDVMESPLLAVITAIT
jgi:hypothetical protein